MRNADRRCGHGAAGGERKRGHGSAEAGDRTLDARREIACREERDGEERRRMRMVRAEILKKYIAFMGASCLSVIQPHLMKSKP